MRPCDSSPENGHLRNTYGSISIFVFLPKNQMSEMLESETVPPMPTFDEDIHHTIDDAYDIEEVWEKEIVVGDVFRNLVHHPAQLITRWNWKSGVLASIIRGLIYLTIYLLSGESWTVTLSAVLVEIPFRLVTTGVAGALVQSFRKAKPIWLANTMPTSGWMPAMAAATFCASPIPMSSAAMLIFKMPCWRI